MNALYTIKVSTVIKTGLSNKNVAFGVFCVRGCGISSAQYALFLIVTCITTECFSSGNNHNLTSLLVCLKIFRVKQITDFKDKEQCLKITLKQVNNFN